MRWLFPQKRSSKIQFPASDTFTLLLYHSLIEVFRLCKENDRLATFMSLLFKGISNPDILVVSKILQGTQNFEYWMKEYVGWK